MSQKPAEYTDVYIPRGIWMVIDYPLPRIRALRIDGVLEFEQVNKFGKFRFFFVAPILFFRA